MRKGLLSLESLEETQLDSVEQELDGVEVPTEGEVADIEQTTDANDQWLTENGDKIAEAEEISGVLGDVNEALEPAAAEGGEPLDTNEAAALAVVTEFFQNRLSYQGERIFPSFESFQNDPRRATVLAIEHNKMLGRAIDRNLVLAQEGFLAKLGDSFSFLFTSNKKLRRLNQEVSRQFDQGTPKTDPIKDPGWGRWLNPEAKLEMGAREVLARLQSTKVKDLQAVQDGVNKIVDFIRRAGEVVDESWFMANKEQIARMQEYSGQLAAQVDALKQKYPHVERKGEDASFTPLDKQTKTALVTEIDRVLTASDLENLVNSYEQVWEQINTVSDNSRTRIAKGYAADIQILRQMFNNSGDALDAIYDAYNFRHRLGHAAIKYVQASIG